MVIERVLSAAGWSRCGQGDWAVVLVSPSGRLAARVSPFDPVMPYTADLFRRAAATALVPVLHASREFEGGAVYTVMERLHAAEPHEGKAFFRALAARTPEVTDLARAIDVVVERARRELPWFGPLDENPSNVMRRDGGDLVLTDPFYADGPNLYDSLLADPMRVARAIPEEKRRHMFELPLAESGPFDPDARQRMELGLAAADARLGQGRLP
ncbi:hypothetical protein VV02_02045 [Luteipulveratus mongoliensis]|uniref:Aminoglycoside phosphotransferase domain-containing protein n=2 Tax=Luteipulveratus mongoliensis TaxID=571913 RepID=A0A0K1JDZ7_9MICO|nr:hypothetical protein VV02_02045 [Luteipulveratus mongoliensis]